MNPIEFTERQPQEIPAFLWRDNGKILTAMKTGLDVTEDVEDFLESIGKKRPHALPDFLQEAGGIIYLGAAEDSDVTRAWNDWLESLS